MCIEHPQLGKFDPGESGVEARAPDDVRDVEGASVLQHGQAVARADDPRYPNNAGGGQILSLDPDQGPAVRERVPPCSAADPRPHGQETVEDDTKDETQE